MVRGWADRGRRRSRAELSSGYRVGARWDRRLRRNLKLKCRGKCATTRVRLAAWSAWPSGGPDGTSAAQASCALSRGCYGFCYFQALKKRDQTGYHTYTVTENRTNASDESITFYLDGSEHFSVSESQIGTSTWQAAFDHNMSVILDLAMGGGYPDGVCG